MKCPQCGFESLPGMQYCGRCGTRLAQLCPACKYANPMDYYYCGMCGTRLTQEPSPELQAQLPLPLQPGVPIMRSAPARPLEGERRIATVIMADVRSSTDMIEQFGGSEAWVGMMNRVFQILENEIYRFGGQVDQFRGDGLLAFFGAGAAHEDDPERAILAALCMQQSLKPYTAELAVNQGIDLKMRIGINTGEVIVTGVGDRSQHWEDTAMGEAIAVASRMETAAEPGNILVSENTYKLAASQFTWEPLGEIRVKGISRPLGVYRPLAARLNGFASTELQAYAIATPLTGREAEFEVITRRIDDLYGGKGGIILLSGEQGMGKSFLLTKAHHYFLRQEALRAGARGQEMNPTVGDAGGLDEPSLTWLSGNCHSYDQTWPYSMWVDLLQNWLGTHPDEPREKISERLSQHCELLWGEQSMEYYPFLAAMLALPLDETLKERLQQLDAERLQRQLYLVIRSWIEHMARQGPLILIFKGLQWGDTSGLDLLRYCLPLCDHHPLLFILLFRPERTSAVWDFRHYIETEYPHRLTNLTLQPLTEEQISQLIESNIESTTLSDETLKLIIHKSEGNPYYVQELLRALISQNVLVQDPETRRWREVRPATSLDLPDSLQNLLLARIDRVSPEERHILQMASVIGRVFWKDVLQALAGEEAPISPALTALQRAQLIQERLQTPMLGMEYEFSSSLVHDAAYESLLIASRSAHHLQTAEYLESRLGLEGWSQYFSLIAYHYQHAGNPNKELYYSLQAAEQARRVYANAEAYEHFSRALKLLDQIEAQGPNEDQLYAIRCQRFEVLRGREEMSNLLGNISAGEADARALLPLAKLIADDPTWLIDALLEQPEVHNLNRQEGLASALEIAQEALSLSRKLNDRYREMRSLSILASLRFFNRDPSAKELAERALALARELGDRRFEVSLLLRIGDNIYGMDNLERSLEYLHEALAIVQEVDDWQTELQLLQAIGEQHERNGDYYTLLKEYQEKRLEISRQIGDRLVEANALMYCAQVRGLYLGDYETGLAQAEEAARLWENISDRLFPLLRVAQIQIALGRFAEAQATLEVLQPLAEQNIYDLGQAGFYLVTAILYNTMGERKNLTRVTELADKVQEMVAQNLVSRQYLMAARCESAAAHLALAEGFKRSKSQRQSHVQQALSASQTALDLYLQFNFTRVIECASEEIYFRHSLALEANGRPEEAAGYLQRAYEEMMRKHNLIPKGSPFRKTYLENIALHRQIARRYKNRA